MAIINIEDMLEAAVAIFAEFGDKTTIAQIAKRANVSETAIYRAFSSKEALLLKIYNIFWDRFLADIRAAEEISSWEEEKPRALTKLQKIILYAQKFLSQNTDLVKVVATTYLVPPEKIQDSDLRKKRNVIREKNRQVLAILDKIIEDGQQEDCFIKTLNPKVIRQMLMGAFQLLAYGLMLQFKNQEKVGYTPLEAMNGIAHLIRSLEPMSKKQEEVEKKQEQAK